MGNVAVIGDVGGHLDQLRAALARLGAVGERLRLPPDLTVIQVGDLVDRGPDSSGVLHLVDWYLHEQPEQWIQLIGNHEAQYLPGGVSFWADQVAEADAALLRSWWSTGRMLVGATVRTADGNETLMTHAGLTVDAWRNLGEPRTATSAAVLLNQRPEPLIWLGDGFRTDTIAGPLWAEAGWELCEPWLRFAAEGGLVPFDQVHGHSSIIRFDDHAWQCPGRVRHRATINHETRQARVRIGGRTITGVDPRHGSGGAPHWQPLVFQHAEVLVGSDDLSPVPQD